jgi:inorganic triphosphatase YgiF
LPARETITPRTFESEIALIIKDNADRIRKEVADLRHILDYDIKPKPPQVIYDTYFDTWEDSLRRRKITLRTRRLGRTLLISTKSDVRRIAGNIVRRRETELPWSYNSVRLLARILKLKTPTTSVSQFHGMPVSRAFEAMGLEVIQERHTRREARDVAKRDKKATPILAELAIDRVTYTFNDIKVRLSEIEVEAKSARSHASIREIANALISKYHPIIQQWFHGKFVTGLAIRKLLETNAFQRGLANGDLGPEAFKLIDRAIKSRRF